MNATAKVVLVALAAGALGIVASLVLNRPGPGPLLSTELGQRALQGALSATAPAAPEGLAVARRGEPVPGFGLPALDGGPVAIPDAWAGRPVLVNIWASWCGPCIEEMPELQRYALEQGANGTQVVGIALDDEASVRDFLGRVPVDYPILMDTPGPADAGVRLGQSEGGLAVLGADRCAGPPGQAAHRAVRAWRDRPLGAGWIRTGSRRTQAIGTTQAARIQTSD
jgi:thiol-disulfide isomerase/thioredoxin